MSAVRPCGGKVRPTTLASAPEEEEKGEGQREITGYSTAPKSATNSGGISVLRREICETWRREPKGKRKEMVESSGVYKGRLFGVWEGRGRGGIDGKRSQWRSNGRRLGKALTGGFHLSVVKKK
jgi:hypothetical protein